MAGDPDLAAWWRAEREFDAVLMKNFQTVPVPLELKEQMLRAAQVPNA